MNEKPLLTIEECAGEWSLSVRTIRYLIARGELAPVIHIGRSVRIPASTMRVFVEERIAAAQSARIEPSALVDTRRRVG